MARGRKQLKKCGFNFKIPKTPYRCEACIFGKFHILPHTKGKSSFSGYLPGEIIHTDLQGPYTRSLKGEKYSQVFLDVISRMVWSVKLGSKTESTEAIRKV